MTNDIVLGNTEYAFYLKYAQYGDYKNATFKCMIALNERICPFALTDLDCGNSYRHPYEGSSDYVIDHTQFASITDVINHFDAKHRTTHNTLSQYRDFERVIENVRVIEKLESEMDGKMAGVSNLRKMRNVHLYLLNKECDIPLSLLALFYHSDSGKIGQRCYSGMNKLGRNKPEWIQKIESDL